MTEPARKPSAWWYGVGAALMVVGCTAAVLYGCRAASASMKRMDRYTAPGEWDVPLRAGRTSFFLESPGSPPDCTLTGPPRAAVSFEEPAIVQRYDRAGYRGRSFRTADVDEDGTYHLRCRSPGGPRVLATGDGFTVRTIIPSIIGGAAAIFVGVPIMAVTLIRRRSRNRPDFIQR